VKILFADFDWLQKARTRTERQIWECWNI